MVYVYVMYSAVSLELQLLSDIEEHLKCTITQCEPDIKVPVDEFDGKVSYGQRRALGGVCLFMSTTHSTQAAKYTQLISVTIKQRWNI